MIKTLLIIIIGISLISSPFIKESDDDNDNTIEYEETIIEYDTNLFICILQELDESPNDWSTIWNDDTSFLLINEYQSISLEYIKEPNALLIRYMEDYHDLGYNMEKIIKVSLIKKYDL